MGKQMLQIRQFHTWGNDKIMLDAQPVLFLDEDLTFQEQIKVFPYMTGKGIFNWDDRAAGAPGIEGVKDIRRSATRKHLR
jgi:hypothetical protein